MVFQNVDPKSLSKMLDLPDPRQFLVQMDPDIAKAEWENGLLMQGIPVVPEDFDVHDAHIMEHNRERKSPAYELADPQVKQIIDMHIMAHMQFLGNETAAVMAQSDQAVMGEMQDPGITAALNAGVGLPLPEDGMMQEQEMMDEQSMGMAGGLPPEAMSMMGGQEGSIPMMGMEESMGEEMLPGMEGM
jgi:hypothetical protein